TLRDIGYSRHHDPADSHFQAIGRLVDLARQYDFPAAFYFMTSEPGPRDDGYQLASSPGQAALARIRGAGHELGLHPGYTTFLDTAELERQRERFAAATGLTSYGGRQHYLRFRVPQTWRDWADAGFRYDSTLGYATAPGFRAGTCLPFQPYDLAADEPIDLIELPLIAMDVTFTSPTYLGLTPAQAEAQILELARRCQAVAGCFTLLWHNGTMEPPLDALYETILGRLRQLMDDADE
ncbi:MAG: polysaccharide deacetylase family protein, partial [Anaerolineales bacterium]|nr:polysaccharide deacetylase family protein [Anaerolineales bacterium]